MRFLLAGLLLLPFSAQAAFDVVLSVAPESPQPYAPITVTATPIGFNATETPFTWLVNDDVVGSGYGIDTITLTAPALGETLSVRLLIRDEERARPLTIRPARVTIEWEGITEVPPAYVGRPLVGGQGAVRAVAIPEFIAQNRRVPSSQINYTWRLNGSTLTKLSGYGRDRVIVEPPFYDTPFTLSVEAEGGGVRAAYATRIRAVSPDIVIYEFSPLSGILSNRALGSDYFFSASEASFIAYGLHTSRPASLSYQWKLGGTPIELQTGDPRVAVFKKTGEGEGAYQVSVKLMNDDAFLDVFERSFLLHF